MNHDVDFHHFGKVFPTRSLHVLCFVLLDFTAGTVCHKPDNPYASYVYDGDIKEAGLGTELTVKCKDQYKEGSPVITCTDGRWSDPDPPCQCRCGMLF